MSGRISVLALVLTACAHSPQPTFYTLSAREGEVHAEVTGVIEVRTPHVAGYLDRHELVLGMEGQRLQLDRDAHWAEPLRAMLARVLASALAQRLPHAHVVTDDGHVHAQPSVRIELDVRRFERDADGQLRLDALVALRTGTPAGAPRLETIALRADAHGQRSSALVRSMSDAIGALADRLAGMTAGMTAKK